MARVIFGSTSALSSIVHNGKNWIIESEAEPNTTLAKYYHGVPQFGLICQDMYTKIKFNL